MNTRTNRAAELDALLTELRQIEGPNTDYAPWWAKVRGINARLAAEGQEQLDLTDLTSANHKNYRTA